MENNSQREREREREREHEGNAYWWVHERDEYLLVFAIQCAKARKRWVLDGVKQEQEPASHC